MTNASPTAANRHSLHSDDPAVAAAARVDFAGLRLQSPVFTASGTCGYGLEYGDLVDLRQLGGFITKSVTREPRLGNESPRIVETRSGMINAIGLANVGLERFLSDKVPPLAQLSQASVAAFANVAGYTVDDYVAVVRRLALETAIAGIELNISCPNVRQGGLTFGTDAGAVQAITRAVRQAIDDAAASCGHRCVLMVKLSPNVTNIADMARAAVDGGADALSLVNTFTAMAIDIHTRRPRLANGTGGLSGPAIKPIALYMVHKVYREVARSAGVPILGLGGIQTWQDAAEFILAGATAVAMGTSLFLDPAGPLAVSQALSQWARGLGVQRVCDLIGALEMPGDTPCHDGAAYVAAVPRSTAPADW